MTNIKHSGRFFEALANLFYAVAMADGTMSRKEKLKIINLVEKYWTVEVNGGNSETLMYHTLKHLILKRAKVSDTFEVFTKYYNENLSTFDNTLKTQLLESCYAIANAVNKAGKSEVILLTKLSLLFKTE